MHGSNLPESASTLRNSPKQPGDPRSEPDSDVTMCAASFPGRAGHDLVGHAPAQCGRWHRHPRPAGIVVEADPCCCPRHHLPALGAGDRLGGERALSNLLPHHNRLFFTELTGLPSKVCITVLRSDAIFAYLVDIRKYY